MLRRSFLKAPLLATTSGLSLATAADVEKIKTRTIPSSGEALPIIGVGTWQTFDVGSGAEELDQLSQVLAALVTAGGSVVDSSPMYGRSESVVGKLAKAGGIEDELFYATKVWTTGEASGVEQMRRSMQRMQVETMDLMQVHNLLDAEIHLQTLTEWKQSGMIRYFGITHYHQGGYAEMARLMKLYSLDFIQVNYSILSTQAENEILPLAHDRGIAVLINRPYEGGAVFRRIKNKPPANWLADFDCQSWGQFFLKFVLANRAVTCVIPGTSKPHHMLDNIAAGRGYIPSQNDQTRMLSLFKKL